MAEKKQDDTSKTPEDKQKSSELDEADLTRITGGTVDNNVRQLVTLVKSDIAKVKKFSIEDQKLFYVKDLAPNIKKWGQSAKDYGGAGKKDDFNAMDGMLGNVEAFGKSLIKK